MQTHLVIMILILLSSFSLNAGTDQNYPEITTSLEELQELTTVEISPVLHRDKTTGRSYPVYAGNMVYSGNKQANYVCQRVGFKSAVAFQRKFNQEENMAYAEYRAPDKPIKIVEAGLGLFARSIFAVFTSITCQR